MRPLGQLRFTGQVTDPRISRAVDFAVPTIKASTAAWGVRECHWLPDRDGTPALWLTTGTEAQRAALEASAWLSSQVAMMLSRQGVPYEVVKVVRIFIDSAEGQRDLLAT
jgi:hypothetical protein